MKTTENQTTPAEYSKVIREQVGTLTEVITPTVLPKLDTETAMAAFGEKQDAAFNKLFSSIADTSEATTPDEIAARVRTAIAFSKEAQKVVTGGRWEAWIRDAIKLSQKNIEAFNEWNATFNAGKSQTWKTLTAILGAEYIRPLKNAFKDEDPEDNNRAANFDKIFQRVFERLARVSGGQKLGIFDCIGDADKLDANGWTEAAKKQRERDAEKTEKKAKADATAARKRATELTEKASAPDATPAQKTAAKEARDTADRLEKAAGLTGAQVQVAAGTKTENTDSVRWETLYELAKPAHMAPTNSPLGKAVDAIAKATANLTKEQRREVAAHLMVDTHGRLAKLED